MCPFLKTKNLISQINNFTKEKNLNLLPTKPLPESSTSPAAQRHRVFKFQFKFRCYFVLMVFESQKEKSSSPSWIRKHARFHFLNFTERINYSWKGSKPETNTLASKRGSQIPGRRDCVSTVCFKIPGRTKRQETFVYVRSLARC